MFLKPEQVKEKLKESTVCFVDVRSLDEFQSGHVPGAQCMPLDEIESGTASVPKDRLVILSCQGGRRSARAREILRARGYENVVELEGGFSAWLSAGLPVNRTKARLPIVRQVLLSAGFLVALGVVLSLFVDTRFVYLPLFVGAGLMFAGSTGICPMAMLLEKMPWNRN